MMTKVQLAIHTGKVGIDRLALADSCHGGRKSSDRLANVLAT